VSLGLEAPIREGFRIGVTTHPRELQLECDPPAIVSGALTWKVEGGAETMVPLAGNPDDPDFWSANIATQPDGTIVRYSVDLELSNGTKIQYPQNPADPLYQFYVGNTETLWCADFEDGQGEWTFGGTNESRVEWAVGMPLGVGGDPKAAHSGVNILGIDLGDDGLYRNRLTQWAESPEIDLKGNTNVRLQYYRWLGVEDAVFDAATISANDQVVWTNYASASTNADGIHHTDKEWRFHDVDLSAQAVAGKLKLKFALESDQGLALAGWNIDDVCIVMAGPPSNTCGNHNVDEGETCDDGNSEDGDACPADCGVEPTGCGCNTGGSPVAPLALSLLTLGFVVRRRRQK
jgi:cysteine-rich repeat protein